MYEVDLAAISRAKSATITRNADLFPTTNVVPVEIDFETQDLDATLAEAGFIVGARTFFTWEGVPMYLTRAAVKATLDAVWKMSGQGSVIAHDMWHLVDDPGPMGTARRLAPSALSFIGEPVTFSVHPEEMDHFLRRRRFRITDLAVARELLDRYAGGERALLDESMYVLAAERLDE